MRNYFFQTVLLSIWLCSCNEQSAEKKQEKQELTNSASIGCAPEVSDKSWYSSGSKAPLIKGLDVLHFKVSTKSDEAQKYFDQGLILSFGFNHAEAGRSFYEATRLDSNCAMGWWGFAYVLGPNYNAGMEKDNFQRAYEAVLKAKSKTKSCTQKEKDLIEALTSRYTIDTTIGRGTLDSAYADAMRRLYKKYDSDVTVGALFAESLLDLHPWNLWQKDGTMQPWTPEIIAVLENCLKLDPRHAAANHFYIHATEMSRHAETASASADRLLDLVPGSGHLVHMPSHTYIRTGRYHDGVVSNQKAVLVDSLYVETCHAQGVYPLAYYPHNYHFMAACATLDGESKVAMKGAMATAEHAHKKLLRDPAWSTLQHYYSIPWYVEVKLGLWNDIIHSPAPEKDLKYPSVVWHYAQGMAKLSGDEIGKAREQLTEMKKIMTDTMIKKQTIWGINTVYDLCVIASKTLEGEIRAKEKDYPGAVKVLMEAVIKEDALNYNEPPDWFFSVRHHLGAILIDAGKYQEAIKVYKKDLEIYPENGWALRGLMNVYEKMGDKGRYGETKRRFETSWQFSDIEIISSRIL
ncbi:MAG: tetratricopeptide repeat protein [Chitinophagaceae bacterium]